VSRRTERVAEEVRGELARLLREEVSDPRVGLVTLTRVEVSPDLGSARVLWSFLPTAAAGTPEREGRRTAQGGQRRTAQGLESAAPFLRRRLAEALPLRRVPELHFRYDPSLAEGSDTLRLLQEIRDAEGS
jgi:ribosome-binding factor A